MKASLKRVASFTTDRKIFAGFVSLLERLDGQHPHLLRVLTYHRVLPLDAHPFPAPGLFSATPERFDQQMGYLAANYRVISVGDLLDAYRNGASLPDRAVMVTFDDAYCDFAVYAWPVLKKYSLPVTLFVPTAYPDHPERSFWWDRLYQAIQETEHRSTLDPSNRRLSLETVEQRDRTFRRLRDHARILPHHEAIAWIDQLLVSLGAHAQVEQKVLGWETLRQLAAEGVTLGAHTRTHPLMNRISPQEARAEAVGSRLDLEQRIGPVLPIFAYPGGGFDEQVVRVLDQEGFELGFTTERGINDLRRAGPLKLRRINIGQRSSLALLRAQLLPWFAYISK